MSEHLHHISASITVKIPVNIYEAMYKFMETYGEQAFGENATYRGKPNMTQLILSSTVRWMDWYCGVSDNLPDGLGTLIGDNKDYSNY